jgi:hypothetical protein
VTTDPMTATRDDVDKAVRRAIEVLAGLGDLEQLHPVDRITVGQAAAQFADVVTSATRRANAARRSKRGTRRRPSPLSATQTADPRSPRGTGMLPTGGDAA